MGLAGEQVPDHGVPDVHMTAPNLCSQGSRKPAQGGRQEMT